MCNPERRRRRAIAGFAVLAAAAAMAPAQAQAQTQAQSQSTGAQTRPMTFLDVQLMRQAAAPTPSPDGKWLLYTVSIPDWKEATKPTDLFLVSMTQGVASTRQLTFTKSKNETSPAWLRDGKSFLFLSNREAPERPENEARRNQLYVMSPEGGEARRVTDAKEGVSDYAVSRDGRWIVYRAGKKGEEQLYKLSVAALAPAAPGAAPHEAAHEQITKQPAAVGNWKFSPDSTRVYFTTANTSDAEERLRRDKKFTVNIRNAETPLASLWALDLASSKATALTPNVPYSVTDFTIADDNKWIAIRGGSGDRYKRNITAEGMYADLYLLEVATGQIERLTNNEEIGETSMSFSPDSKTIAFSAPDDFEKYSMTNGRVYLRATSDRGKPFRKLGASFDGDATIAFWSKDGQTIYFNDGIKATNQFLSLDLAKNAVKQLTHEKASLTVERDDDSGALLINYSDGTTPPTYFTAAGVDQIATRTAWKQLTDTNPQVRQFALGAEEEITWKSKDGTMVGGVLVKPVGYTAGKRYPLIVAIHGGPAAADVLNFNGGYGAQIYAGAGYAVLRPNYRGSTNYGQKHRNDIVGNYFAPGYDDIISGVDHLIAQGIADPDKMGALGWSAGGHWSNWILVQTDRFKAISSGAGTSNWISMYAQSDVQRNRQYYLGNKLPYDDYDAYWNQSPLKYIKNAKTPTMIHVVEGDPRVPSPQSIELHMALKQLGVPTELYMYPGSTHGIPDPRNQMVKSVSEMAWMDYYVRGQGQKFSWREVLKTLEESGATAKATTTNDKEQ
jgi:dipeptidyl aminopeptidase/acylaminoacyl peptidase